MMFNVFSFFDENNLLGDIRRMVGDALDIRSDLKHRNEEP